MCADKPCITQKSDCPFAGPATVEDCEKASALVSALCLRDGAWRMCVPVQRDDSDILLSRIIRSLRALLDERA